MTDQIKIPVDVVIRSDTDDSVKRRVVRNLEDIRSKSKQTKAANKELTGSFSKLSAGVRAVDGPLGGVASRMSTLKGIMQSTGFLVGAFTVGIAGAGFALRNSARDALAFSTAMGEVTTLVNKDFAIKELTQNIRDLSKEFGQLPANQAKAAYQIISAGASSAAEATNLLTAANKLAIGGVTAVTVAADGLTTVLNAYGNKVRGATDVSDTLFVGMRAGKTTIQELSNSVGKVAPLAAQVGVSFDELTASVAALTKGGIKTTESVTGIRAILAAVAKPTSEASDLAEKLGINFTVAGLKAQGFTGFLANLVEKTDGNTTAMAQLFGGVEALIPILALSGTAGQDFISIMEDMSDKAGQTEIAFEKMADTPQQAINRLKSQFIDLSVSIGDSFLSGIIPAVQFATSNFDTMVGAVEVLASVVAIRMVVAIGSFTAAIIANTAASVANTGALIARTAAIYNISRASAAAAVATRGLTASLAFFGGPVGLAITAVAGAVYLLSGRQSLAERSATQHADAMARLHVVGTLVNSGSKQIASSAREEAKMHLENAAAIIKETQAEIKLIEARRTSITSGFRMKAGIEPQYQAQAQNQIDQLYEELDKQFDVVTKSQEALAGIGPTSDESAPGVKELREQLESLREALASRGDGSSVSGAMEEVKKKTKEVKEEFEEFEKVTKILERAGERIFDSFADVIENGLKGELTTFKDFGNSIYDIMSSTFANISALALAKPIVLPIIAGAAGALGLPDGVTNQLGDSFGVSNLSDLAGNASNLYDLVNSGLSTNLIGSTGIGKAIDSVGQSVFGIGQAVNGPFTGPAPFTDGVVGGVTDAINPGNIAGGFIGSTAADLFGLSNENAVVNMAASTIGAVVGQYLIPIPVLGSAIGSFVGSAIGGLFGGKPSDKGQWAVADIGGNLLQEGGLEGDKFSQENRDIATTFSQLGGTIAQMFETLSGQTAEGFDQVQVKIGNRDGSFVNFGQNGEFKVEERLNVESSGSAITEAIVTGLLERFTELPGNLTTMIGNLDFSNVDQAISDLDTVASFSQMFQEIEEPIAQTVQLLESVDSSFSTMRETLVKLGASSEDLIKLEEKRAEALDQTYSAISKTAEDAFLNSVSPAILQLEQLKTGYDAQLKEFNAAGISTNFLDATFEIEQQKLYQQIATEVHSERISQLQEEATVASQLVDEYSRLSDSLGNAITNLRISDISPMGLEDRLAEARSNFVDTSSRAALGDTQAMGELEGLGNTFLALSRDYYASTDKFVQDFNLVESKLTQAKSVADRQLSVQEQIANSANNEIAVMSSSTQSIVSSLDAQTILLQKIADGSVTSVSLSAANDNSTGGTNSFDQNQFMSDRPDIAAAGHTFESWFKAHGSNLPSELENLQSNYNFIDGATSAGIPGYDKGGDVIGNGLFMVGETRPEIYKSGNSGGKVMPIENGQNLEKRIESLENQTRKTNLILQHGFKKMTENQEVQISTGNKTNQVMNRANG